MLMLVMIFSACGAHQHTWVEATCTEPKTCSGCGETEGEALGHSWAEATYDKPKTCSICGDTEGKALEHLWQEATYEEPKTCLRCGLTKGDPLEFKYFDISFSQYIKDFNSEYSNVGWLLEKVENRGFITHLSGVDFIVFNEDTSTKKPGVVSAYSTTEHEHFNRLLVRYVDKSSNQLNSDIRVVVVEAGMFFAKILDPLFTTDEYLNNLMNVNGELISTVNGITYAFRSYNSSVGDILQYTYDFEITI